MKKIKRNFKAATKKDAIKDVLVGIVVGPIIYTMVPTLLKMSGPGAVATGAVTTWLVGAATGQRGLQIAGPVCGGVHLMYVYGNNFVVDILNRPIFRYQSGAASAALNDVMNVGGERILAQRASDLPAPSYSQQGMSDYQPYQLEGFVSRGTTPSLPQPEPRPAVSRGRVLGGASVAR